ncbi:MAG: sigma-70 family RNA polymerase sigma factor [Planctomycetota bacterium]
MTEQAHRSREFARLHGECAPKLCAWVALRLGAGLRSGVDVEDIVQEVTCRAWRRFEDFDADRGPFVSWVLGIARNVFGELLARLARGEPSGGQWSTGSWAHLPDDATRATQKIARQDHLTKFARWAESLEENDQRLLLYRGIENWPHARVGEVLGISESAASQRWAALRDRLRDQPRMVELLDSN